MANETKDRDLPQGSPEEVASVAQQIEELRGKAQDGALGDDLLEDVSGGHTNTTHSSTTHTNSPSFEGGSFGIGGSDT
jgi:hypothetical protein